ncbi:hypothetical protein FM109_03650 [Vibrio casei]|uniref:Lipopeptide n=1 Tax=Vibrio casei TaxID=673372 RepID=A0A368LK52_9VIBR|nr:hypothetical protein CIK83_00200 [Vibrio casei]SJN21532.1 hypothetical protein FM109_03650 [Vibrio casei]
MKKYILALFMLALTALAGCGQTGPLYLPEDAPKPANTEAVTIKGSDGSVTTQPQESFEVSAAQSTLPESEQQAQ